LYSSFLKRKEEFLMKFKTRSNELRQMVET